MKRLSFPYKMEGDGNRTILFIPGLLGDTESFRDVAMRFVNDGWRVIRVSYPETPFSLMDFAEELLRLSDGRLTVVGTSMGGYTAQLMATREPGRIENLVLVNTFPSVRRMMGGLRWLVKLMNFLPKSFVKGQMRRGITDAHFGGNEVVKKKILDFIEKTDASVLFNRVKALAEAPEIEDFPRGIRTIVFFTKGDPTVPDTLKEELVERVNPHLVYEFEEGGHFPYIHDPDKFYRILKSALEGSDR